MYSPDELDMVLSFLPSNGDTLAGGRISDPKLRPILKYLEAKGLVELEEAEGGAGFNGMANQ